MSNVDDFMEEGLQAFAEESSELLEKTEEILLRLEENPDNDDLVNELFRAVHTIKGSSGIFGFMHVVEFTHVAESVMGKVRDHEIPLDENLMGLLLASRDQISSLVSDVLDGNSGDLPPAIKQSGDELLAKLNQYLGESPPQNQNVSASSVPADTTDENTESDDARVESDFWHISVRFNSNVLENGMDPLSFFRYMPTVGDVINMTPMTETIPVLAEMNPESCYLGFEIDLKTSASKDEIADIFEFVKDDCVLNILPPRSSLSDFTALIESLPEENMTIGEILVKSGALTVDELNQALNTQDGQTIVETSVDDEGIESEQVTKPQLGEVMIQQGSVNQPVIDAAVKKQNQVKEAKKIQQQTIRVNADKLGNLINLVGELVISSAHTELKAKQSEQTELLEVAEHMTRLVEEIRDATLGLRMVQIGDTFSRFKRVVRDLSRELGKKIDFQISGGDTELDKTVVEKIGDPLMHLVRNALDHGIELPEVRAKHGKDEMATVRLNAFHDSGSIVIQIIDDGNGMDPDKLVAKAVANGIIQENHNLTNSEIYRLIFEPGFSTAEQVSNISGRGVGMDVVRRNIEELRGQIDIESELGKGSTFSIRLPLTMAIIDGFQVHVGKSAYVIPLDLVDECIELQETMHEQGEYINLRGEVMPFIKLNEIFGETPRKRDKKNRDNIVVVQFAGQKTGLVVDELLGEYQTVIKPLGKVFSNLKGISGATILGSGEVAMIIDVPALVHHASQLKRIDHKPIISKELH